MAARARRRGAPGLTAEEAVARAHRAEWARLVATLIRVTGDWSLAEDAAQDALEKALRRWPTDGVPDNPGAWLTTVARNAALDRLRRREREVRKLRELVADEPDLGTAPEASATVGATWDELADDRLRLVFTCAHPALSPEARVALTLQTVGGLTTREIARAFAVPEPTMAQRLVRAKRRIAGAGIPYRVPSAEELPERLDGVLAVLYLVFSEGYAASSGDDSVRVDLAEEAIRLLRLTIALLPDDVLDEARALLALQLLQHARRRARTDADGVPVPFEEQDRGLWDLAALAEAADLLTAPHRVRGGYRVQAEIAAEHALSPAAGLVDWPRVVALYDELMTFTASRTAAVSRAIALGFAEGWPTGLAELDRLEASGRHAGDHVLPLARADLARRAGRLVEAEASYRVALELAPTAPERTGILRRLRELADG